MEVTISTWGYTLLEDAVTQESFLLRHRDTRAMKLCAPLARTVRAEMDAVTRDRLADWPTVESIFERQVPRHR